MNIGHVIRRRRNAKKFTLEQFAAMIDSDAGNLSRVERGLQNYTPTLLSAVAAALGTTVSDLAAEAELPELPEVSEEPPRDMTEREERDLLRAYWQLDRSSRTALRQIVAQMAKAAVPAPHRHT